MDVDTRAEPHVMTPSPERGEGTRCSATTRAGSPCRMRPVIGSSLCVAHGASPEERKQLARKAAAASAQVRKERAARRQEAVEEARIEARLGVDHWIAIEADQHDQELAKALVSRALSNPDGRAMTMLLERRLGKVVDRIELSGDSPPEEMSEAQLTAWLSADLDRLPTTED